MLNRLYIVIGTLAILVLGAGFVVPHLIDWSGYRARIETLAEASLGTDVIIGGDIRFTLLPRPRVEFGNTVVGPALSPLVEIRSVVADFSLMDFLRDRFTITSLELVSPTLTLRIGREGMVEFPLELTETFEAGNLSVARADIIGGRLRFIDERADQMWEFEEFAGDLSASGVRGPFSLRGVGRLGERPHMVRLNLSVLNRDLEAQASFFWKPVDGAYSISGEGVVAFGERPGFEGETVFRRAPQILSEADVVRGDSVFSSRLQVSTERILFSEFLFQPDENQAGSRLSGFASIVLGELPSFEAVVSGGVLNMTPLELPDAQGDAPYQLIGFLTGLGVPPVPPVPGRIGVDIAEMSMNGFSLRNVRLDASSDALSWSLDNFYSSLPGDSRIHLSGNIADRDGLPGFEGTLRLESERLGVLARAWSGDEDLALLHNSAGVISSQVGFDGSVLLLSNGTLGVEGAEHDFGARLALLGERSALISLRFSPMDARQSRAMLALMPSISSRSAFLRSFPSGSVDLVVSQAELLDLEARQLALQLDWSPQGVHVERLSAEDLGGARLALTGGVEGDFGVPEFFGGGRVTLNERAAEGILAVLVGLAGGGEIVRDWVGRPLPVDLIMDVSPVLEGGEQVISAQGRASAADFELTLKLGGGLANFSSAPLELDLSLLSQTPDELTGQLGLGNVSLLEPGAPVGLQLRARGTVSNSLEVGLNATGGADSVEYNGSLIVSDPARLRGRGRVDFAVSDFSPFLELAGAGGLHVPGAVGAADLSFGHRLLALDNLRIPGELGDVNPLEGRVSITGEGRARRISGQFVTSDLDLSGLVSLMAGPAALVPGEGIWPEGPIDPGQVRRDMAGRIGLRVPNILAGERVLVSNATLDLVWDEKEVGLENFSGTSGGGAVQGEVKLCCAAVEGPRQISGRLSVAGVPAAAVLPEAVALNVSGVLDAGVQFESNGESLAQMVRGLLADGSFTLKEAGIERLDPDAFGALVSLEEVSELEGQDIVSLIGVALDQGRFEAERISGTFQVAGGRLRADNIAVSGQSARLFGNLRIDLAELGLGGRWEMTPNEIEDPDGLLDVSNAQIAVVLEGSLLAPERRLDLGEMIDALQVRALEMELQRLEELRLEQEARSREAALQRARLMELEAQRKQEEAERLAAEEERRRLEQEAAARRAAEDAQDPLIFDFNSADPLLLFNPDQPEDLLGQ